MNFKKLVDNIAGKTVSEYKVWPHMMVIHFTDNTCMFLRSSKLEPESENDEDFGLIIEQKIPPMTPSEMFQMGFISFADKDALEREILKRYPSVPEGTKIRIQPK